MEHDVAVGAHRNEVFDGFDMVAFATRRHEDMVVDIYESIAQFAVGLVELHLAYGAGGSVVGDAGVACFAIAFVLVDGAALKVFAVRDAFLAIVARSPRIAAGAECDS